MSYQSYRLLWAFAVAAVILLVAVFASGQTYRVTAYCPCKKCCGPHAKGITAGHTRARYGTCAADWRVLRKGTVVSILGYGTARVEDTGSAIKGRRIDVFFPTHAQAKRFGVRWLTVKVLSRPLK